MRRNKRYRYLINDNPMGLEVHDLDNEKTGPSECQIDEIRNYRWLVGTTETDLVFWLNENREYDGCAYCLLHLHWK